MLYRKLYEIALQESVDISCSLCVVEYSMWKSTVCGRVQYVVVQCVVVQCVVVQCVVEYSIW